MKEKVSAFGILLLAIGLLITLSGCPGPTSGPTPTPGVFVISPTVTLNDTTNYQVESAYIGKSDTSLAWVYGIVKINYLGSVSKSFIGVDASFKDKNDNELFTNFSYVCNIIPCQIPSVPCNTTTFFTSTYNYGYYFIIEDLIDYEITITDIAKIDLTISSSSYTYTAARGHLSKSGTPYRVEPDSWYVDVINDGAQVIDSYFTRLIFNDSLNRQYMWHFPSLYINSVFTSTIGVGQSGYFSSLYNTPDYRTTPFGFGDTLLEWDLNISSSIIPSIMKDRSISDDQKNKLILQQIDERTRQQLVKYCNR